MGFYFRKITFLKIKSHDEKGRILKCLQGTDIELNKKKHEFVQPFASHKTPT